jgi:hypothetical protein
MAIGQATFSDMGGAPAPPRRPRATFATISPARCRPHGIVCKLPELGPDNLEFE